MDSSVADDVLRAIRRIVRKISEHSRDLSQVSGLTLPQLMCLRSIGDLEDTTDVTVKRVAQALQLSPTTVSRIVDRLVRKGLVLRERSQTDRRRVCLSLTLAGNERFENLPTPLQEHFVARLAALDASEQQSLLSSLQQVVDLMEATDIEASPLLAASSPLDPDR